MNYQKRIKKLQKKLRRKNLEAILIANPENRRYLSGYSGEDHGIAESSGILLVPVEGRSHLLTDFRFKIQARREASLSRVTIYRKGLLDLLPKLLKELGISRLGFEAHYTLFSTTKSLKKALAREKIYLVPTEGIIEKMRSIKDKEEIDCLRRAVRLGEKVFQSVFNSFDDYQTETEVALAIEEQMRLKGSEGASFSTIVAFGGNGALPHAVPGSTVLQEGDSVTIDMGLFLEGYSSDMTRNFVRGKVPDKYSRLHRLVRQAQLAGMAAIRAGVRCCDVDSAARRIINDAGYGKYFGHALGHGVGLAVHEAPRLSAFSKMKLKPGMIITVEPGIYIPDWGGIRLENMVVVREDGFEDLNQDKTWLDI